MIYHIFYSMSNSDFRSIADCYPGMSSRHSHLSSKKEQEGETEAETGIGYGARRREE